MYSIRMKKLLNSALHISIMAGLIFVLTGCGKKYVKSEAVELLKNDFGPLDERQVSLETRDYIISMVIDEVAGASGNDKQEPYKFTFTLADLAEYSGDTGKSFKTSEYICYADSLETALDRYFEENERQLDMGHISDIYINDSTLDIKSNELVYEMSRFPSVAKSVQTTLTSGGVAKELILRELIKNVYAGEDF